MGIYDTKKEQSLKRARELEDIVAEYNEAKHRIKTGITEKEKIRVRKKQIQKILNATQQDWDDYKWQQSNRNWRCRNIS